MIVEWLKQSRTKSWKNKNKAEVIVDPKMESCLDSWKAETEQNQELKNKNKAEVIVDPKMESCLDSCKLLGSGRSGR